MEEELPPFSGTCQIDDTLIGTVADLPVVVIACKEQESGQVQAQVVLGEMSLDHSTPFIKSVTTKDSLLFTDETAKYPYGLRDRLTINHSKSEFARWDDEHHVLVTTNAIESFWTTLKTLLRRHRAVTLRHLYLYVAAAAWHISHLGESTVDQMRALIRNSHQAWSRPVRDTHEDLLPLQLELRKRRTSAASGPKHPLKRMGQLPLETPEVRVASKTPRISRRKRRTT